MLVNGVNVEKIVLDTSGNLSESGEYSRQNATLLHHFKAAIGALWLGENGEKFPPRNGVAIQVTRVNSAPEPEKLALGLGIGGAPPSVLRRAAEQAQNVLEQLRIIAAQRGPGQCGALVGFHWCRLAGGQLLRDIFLRNGRDAQDVGEGAVELLH